MLSQIPQVFVLPTPRRPRPQSPNNATNNNANNNNNNSKIIVIIIVIILILIIIIIIITIIMSNNVNESFVFLPTASPTSPTEPQ